MAEVEVENVRVTVVSEAAARDTNEEADLPEFRVDPDGKTWRLVDDDYFCVSSDREDSGGEAEEYDPVASARLFQRTIRCFERRSIGVSREQLTEMRRRCEAKRAERVREASPPAQSNQARSSHPKAMPAPRPRATRTRRPSTRSPATADTTPPPEPEPAAVSAVSDLGLAGQPLRTVAALARPPASLDTRLSALRGGAADRVGGSLPTPQSDAVGLRSSASRRSARSGAMPSLETRLDSFALALPSVFAALARRVLEKSPEDRPRTRRSDRAMGDQAGAGARGHR
jgi:hypothetical protein